MHPVCAPPVIPQEPPSYASLEEARTALQDLTGADLKKLGLIAFMHCNAFGIPSGHMEPRELLHEAVARTLDGRKQWRRGVSLLRHLHRAMENIAGHEVPKLQRRVDLSPSLGDEEDPEVDDPIDRLRDLRNYNRDTDARAAAREEVEDIYSLFNDDAEARAVLKSRAEGHEKREILTLCDLSNTAYATISKRILRKITSYYEQRSTAR